MDGNLQLPRKVATIAQNVIPDKKRLLPAMPKLSSEYVATKAKDFQLPNPNILSSAKYDSMNNDARLHF